MFGLANNLSSVSRYSQSHLIKSESVLEHSGFVALVCYTIGSRIPGIDMGELLSKAIVHDIDETITGDIPRPTRYANNEIFEAINKVERKNMMFISQSILGNGIMYSDWQSAKDDTIEGTIVRIADSLAVLYKVWQEYTLYNSNTIVDHAKSVAESLESIETTELELELIIAEAINLCSRILGEHHENQNNK